MSLADLLNLGRKEQPKKEDEPKAPEKREDSEPDSPVFVPKAPKLDEKEAAFLKEQLANQSKEMILQEEKRRAEEKKVLAGQKRVLEEAAEQAAAIAKKQKEESSTLEKWHKTTLCKFFFQSRCDKGTFCPFAHSLESLIEATSATKLTSRAKTKLCRHFEIGQCMNGDYCQYIHNVPEMPPGGWMGDSWMMGDGSQMMGGQMMGDGYGWGDDWSGWDASGGSSGSGYNGSASTRM